MSSMFCKKIYQCKNADWCARDFNPKSDEPECFEHMNRGDRFRSMNNFQLADFFAQLMDSCFNSGRYGECDEDCPMYDCCNNQESDNIEDWLDQGC